MTWFPDMGPAAMIDEGDHIRAVGWLSATHHFDEGDVSDEFLTRLKEFAKRSCESTEALGWGIFMGPHCCYICGRFMAAGNFGVPSGRLLFVAPEMIAHYVEAHHYCPPEAFIEAVKNSPLPGSDEYHSAVDLFRQMTARRETL
jgi:hypothetical protein